MTPDQSAALAAALRRRAEDKAEFRSDLERLARDRAGMTCDASVIRFDDPDREAWIA